MHIGVFQADTHSLDVLNRYGSYSEMFQRLLHRVDEQLTFTTYQVIKSEYPQTLNECDAYLISGSKQSVYENRAWMGKLKNFILHSLHQDTKLIGICFGHQIIAAALGGKVQKAENGWAVGVMSSELVEIQQWMKPTMKSYSLLVSHQDQVSQLPEQATLIATNDFCAISAYRIGKNILSLQGHPEFSVSYLAERMLKRRERIGENKYQQAVLSLEQDTDHHSIAHWIINFIHQ